MGETGLTHDIFFEFPLGPFEVVEAEGGHIVKEADFEAEKFLARVLAKALNLVFHLTSTTSKGLSENLKKLSWDHPVFSHRC